MFRQSRRAAGGACGPRRIDSFTRSLEEFNPHQPGFTAKARGHKVLARRDCGPARLLAWSAPPGATVPEKGNLARHNDATMWAEYMGVAPDSSAPLQYLLGAGPCLPPGALQMEDPSDSDTNSDEFADLAFRSVMPVGSGPCEPQQLMWRGKEHTFVWNVATAHLKLQGRDTRLTSPQFYLPSLPQRPIMMVLQPLVTNLKKGGRNFGSAGSKGKLEVHYQEGQFLAMTILIESGPWRDDQDPAPAVESRLFSRQRNLPYHHDFTRSGRWHATEVDDVVNALDGYRCFLQEKPPKVCSLRFILKVSVLRPFDPTAP